MTENVQHFLRCVPDDLWWCGSKWGHRMSFNWCRLAEKPLTAISTRWSGVDNIKHSDSPWGWLRVMGINIATYSMNQNTVHNAHPLHKRFWQNFLKDVPDPISYFNAQDVHSILCNLSAADGARIIVSSLDDLEVVEVDVGQTIVDQFAGYTKGNIHARCLKWIDDVAIPQKYVNIYNQRKKIRQYNQMV